MDVSSGRKDEDDGAGASGDLFLSYSRADTETVLAVQRLLTARGISTFLDRDRLEVGMPWPQALETGLKRARGVAVFIGPSGLGLWQKREMGFALDRQVQEERESKAFPVIPILLPDADITPGFLFLNTWIDLRRDLTDPDAMNALARAVQGEKTDVVQEELAALCPYRGLRPFSEEDAAFFFGRTAFSERLLEAILERNIVAVIGPSGSGKSSVVQAGVMPKLRRMRPPSTWDAVAFVSGNRPFHNLAVALSPYLTPDLSDVDRLTEAKKLGDRLKGGDLGLEDVVKTLLRKSDGTDRLLLVVDQFEELYTQCPEPIRAAFLDKLLTGLDQSPLTLVLTLRGSFYDRVIASNRSLSDRLEHGAINLGPMTREELEQAIVKPAERVGLSFEEGLPGRLLDDVGESPGNLPLLEFALTELWARRQGQVLTHSAYEEIGQVAGAIAQRADSIFKKLTPEQQAITRRVFTRLVWTSDTPNDGQTARQRASVASLGEESRPIINALVDGRLLVMARRGPSQEETIEVAHEALIRQWTRLRNWLLEDQEFLLWRQRLQTDLADWQRTDQDRGTLLRGIPLDDAERWTAQRKDDLTPEEQAFIHSSLSERESHRAAVARRRRRLTASILGAALFFLCLAGLSAYQWLQTQAEQLATKAEALLRINPKLGLFLATESTRLAWNEAARAATEDVLRQALVSSHERGRVDMAQERNGGVPVVVTSAVFSPQGNHVITTSDDKKVRLWEWKERTNPAAAEPTVELKLDCVLEETDGDSSRVPFATFGRAGNRIVAVSETGPPRLWDVNDCKRTRYGDSERELEDVRSVAFSATDNCFVTTSSAIENMARVWNWTESKSSTSDESSEIELELELAYELEAHTKRVTSAAFSPDGLRIVTTSEDGTAHLWDVPDCEQGRGTPKQLSNEAGTMQHPEWVTNAAFSPDGRLIVTASVDNIARVWDVSRISDQSEAELKVELRAELKAHSNSISSVAFSPGGRYIVTASRDHTARVWERVCERPSTAGEACQSSHKEAKACSWHEVNVLRGHDDSVMSAQFKPSSAPCDGPKHDALYVVTASRDGTARIWELPQETVLRGHRGSVRSANFSPDDKYVVTAGDDNDARIWDAETGHIWRILKGHDDSVPSAEFSPDGKALLTASWDRTACLWELRNGNIGAGPKVLRGHQAEVRSARFSSDGRYIVTASNDRTARVWDASTGVSRKELGKSVEPLPSHRFVGAPILSPNGKHLLSLSEDGTARVIDVHTGEIGLQLRSPAKPPITSAAFSFDSNSIVTGSEDGSIRLWNMITEESRELLGHSAAVTATAFSADGKRIVTASVDRTARLWDVAEGGKQTPLCRLHEHSDAVTWAAFTNDERSISTLDSSGSVRTWGISEFKPLHCEAAQIKRLYSAAFSPDGRYVVTTSADTTARLWEWDTGSTLHVLRGHQGAVLDAAFGPADSNSVVTVSRDHTARVWHVLTGNELHVLAGHTGAVIAVALSPDGRWIATASHDHTARMWDRVTGELLHILTGHAGPLTDVEISPDGKFVATASEDRTGQLWEAATGKVLAVMAGHKNYVSSVAFSSDGNSIVTTSLDRTARVWRFRDEDGTVKIPPYSRPFDALSTIARAQIEGQLTAGERESYLHEAPWMVRLVKRFSW